LKKFPVVCPKGSRVIITQGFRPLNNPDHDAIDFIIYNDSLSKIMNQRLTYGAQLVQPVKSQCVNLNDFGTMNPLGNGIDFEWKEGEYYFRTHFWHTVYNNFNIGDVVEGGTVVALMGNTGDCTPHYEPEGGDYNGTHCHFRLWRYQKDSYGGNINIESVDPRFFFDILSPYEGPDSDVLVDLEPIKYSWNKLGITSAFDKLKYLLVHIFD